MRIELGPDADADPKSLLEMLRRAIQDSSGEDGAEANAMLLDVDGSAEGDRELSDALSEVLGDGKTGDTKSANFASALLDSMGSLKSSFSTAASSALSALINPNAVNKNRVLIPAVMVSQRYGKELLISYNHLVSKGKKPKLTIDVDSMPSTLDTPMVEGVFEEGKEEQGRFPKMKIEKDGQAQVEITGVRLWTKKSWGVVIQKNKQGTFELRITGRADRKEYAWGWTGLCAGEQLPCFLCISRCI